MSDNQGTKQARGVQDTPEHKDSRWNAFCGSKIAKWVIFPVFFYGFMARDAFAESDLSEMGSQFGSGFCEILNGPIPTLIVGIGIVATIVFSMFAEDKGIVAKFAKYFLGGLVLLFVATLLGTFGFDTSALTGCK